jgi:hypothetical protein
MTTTYQFSVPKKQWNRWNDDEKYIFNSLYGYMKNDQYTFSHPKAAVQNSEYWETTAWNAAWMAADYAKDRRLGVD